MAEFDLYKGLIYTTPKQPKRKDIQGVDLPKKKQKWFRTEIPKHFDALYEELDLLGGQILEIEKACQKLDDKLQVESNKKNKSAEKIAKYNEELDDAYSLINIKVDKSNKIEEEIEIFAFEEDRKCTEGMWFFNNGIPTYINGDHYHYLNWFKLDVGYPQFRDRDKRWFFHWEICDKDEECLGQIYGKQRRDGYSFRVVSVMYNRARKTFNANYGIMSKSKVDSQEMFKKGVDAFMEYPRFFKPQLQNSEDVKQRMVFKTPQQKITYKTRVTKKEVSLNTIIDSHPTTENAMDGSARKIIGCDEAAKFPKDVKLLKWYAIGKICCLLGMKNINGKMLMGSTVNDFENGGEDFMILWALSLHSNKTENNRTDSWMYRYFVDCADGMEGFVDEYGMSVMETPEVPIMGIDGKLITVGSIDYITKELAAKKKSGDSVGYYELRRQFPRVEDDMFITPADEKTCWDIEKIYQQIEHNDIHDIEKTLHCGYFSWANGVRDSTVVWNSLPYDDPMVKHRFAWMPQPADCNKWELKNGKKAPSNTHIGVFTLDPYAAKNTTDKRKSKAASHGFRKFDSLGDKNISDVFIMEYWNRLKDPLLVYEDMILQCVYFGWKLLPERNVKNCNDYFRNREYDNYLMQPPRMTQEEFMAKIDKKEDAGLANTAGKTQQQMVEYQASYITNHIGVNEKTGEMGYMPFNNTLKDWLIFDIDKWTPYDLTISSMLACMARSAVTHLTPRKKIKIDFFKSYDNSGIESREIK